MIDKLKKDKFYIKYGVFIIFIAIIIILSVKVITYGEDLVSWSLYQFKRFITITSPIFYAILLAYLLYKPIKYIEMYIYKGLKSASKNNKFIIYSKMIRVLSVLTIFLLLIAILVIVYNFLVPPILKNIEDVINTLPEFEAQLSSWINNAVESLKSKNIDVQNTGNLTTEIVGGVEGAAEKVLGIIAGALSGISSFILDFVITIILTIYFLLDKERLIIQMKRVRDVLLPKKIRDALTIFLKDLDVIVGQFIIGEILDAVIVGAVSTVLLLLIKHPFAVLIGVIAGITNIIPYVGPIIGAALAFLFGIITSVPLGVTGAILLLLYQQVDGNFVQPKIVGDKIGLSPVWILIAVLIGGSYFGALGMILFMPLAGLFRVYFNRYAKYKEKK